MQYPRYPLWKTSRWKLRKHRTFRSLTRTDLTPHCITFRCDAAKHADAAATVKDTANAADAQKSTETVHGIGSPN